MKMSVNVTLNFIIIIIVVFLYFVECIRGSNLNLNFSTDRKKKKACDWSGGKKKERRVQL